MRDIETIGVSRIITDFELEGINKEDREDIILGNLNYDLARYIIENRDSIPIEQRERMGSEGFEREVSLTLTIISKKELYRLQQIERDYNKWLENYISYRTEE